MWIRRSDQRGDADRMSIDCQIYGQPDKIHGFPFSNDARQAPLMYISASLTSGQGVESRKCHLLLDTKFGHFNHNARSGTQKVLNAPVKTFAIRLLISSIIFFLDRCRHPLPSIVLSQFPRVYGIRPRAQFSTFVFYSTHTVTTQAWQIMFGVRTNWWDHWSGKAAA
jgi:hypothetical protein